MHFNRGNFHCQQSVVECDRGVRVPSSIEDDADSFFGVGLVDEIDQFAFAIGLAAIGLKAKWR